MIETKMGDTFEGKIEDMDKFMNMQLKDGTHFIASTLSLHQIVVIFNH